MWWYMLRRFRHLPVTERHSLVIAVGHIIAHMALMVALVPMSTGASAREGLVIYPPLIALSGLGVFIIGSTNWSRFLPVGLFLMCLAPVLAWWPEASPLVYGVVVSSLLWYWTYAKGAFFATRPDTLP